MLLLCSGVLEGEDMVWVLIVLAVYVGGKCFVLTLFPLIKSAIELIVGTRALLCLAANDFYGIRDFQNCNRLSILWEPRISGEEQLQ
jgi:hypothetical protein